MNVEKLRLYADKIEALKPNSMGDANDGDGLSFDMSRFAYACGTPACIAGWVTWWEHNRNPPRGLLDQVPQHDEAMASGDVGADTFAFTQAKEALKLTREQAHALFYATLAPIDIHEITPQQAAAVMRHLADTGEVNWRKFTEKKVMKIYVECHPNSSYLTLHFQRRFLAGNNSLGGFVNRDKLTALESAVGGTGDLWQALQSSDYFYDPCMRDFRISFHTNRSWSSEEIVEHVAALVSEHLPGLDGTELNIEYMPRPAEFDRPSR